MYSPKMFSCSAITRTLWISQTLFCYCSLLLLLCYCNVCLCEDEIVERCKEKGCNLEVADATSQDLHCNTSCRQHQGNTSEERVKRGVKMQFCILGCQRAVEGYERRIKEKLGELPAPYAMVRTPTSVLLGWNRTQLPNVTYQLQRRYADREADDWADHTHVRWVGDDRLNVTNLHPFVSYKFRIVAVISNRTYVNSLPSGPIATKAYGVPASQPSISSLISSSTSIHIRWASPFFKNGVLLSYQLRLRALNGTRSVPIVKDIQLRRSRSSDVITEIITMLEPNTKYEVTVAARNTYGAGPEARSEIITLPKEERSGETPYLVMGSQHKLRQLNLLEEADPGPQVLYNNSYTTIVGPEILYEQKQLNVKDAAIHYYKGFVFFSNTSGVVYRMERGVQGNILQIYGSNHQPGPLSVDWLHDILYIGEKNMIVSCELDGSSPNVVLDNLPSRPLHIVADPYNGYLYWSHAKPPGLYRIDLADLGTSVYDPSKYRVLQRYTECFRTFTVDFVNYRLYYPVDAESTIRSCNLDGTEEADIRPKHMIQTSQFMNIASMVVLNDYSNQWFYWTNGSRVFYEEYDTFGRIYHNMLMVFDRPFTGLNIWHPSAQPIPVPLQPPRSLQAIFSSNTTTLQWDKPDWDQGEGAWQGWWYQVEVTDIASARVISTIKNVTFRHLKISNLRPQTAYSFRVRAYTSGGHGPWADPFYGETLKNDGSQPYLVYSVSGTIHQVGLDGTKTDDILRLDTSHSINQLLVVNGWYIWLDSQHFVYKKMGAMSPPERIPNISKVLVIAYDWLGEKLYWWNTQNQISRSSLDGHDVENVYQGISPAYHLCIDSREGYMYWATSNTVEVAHLDNKGHKVIRKLPQFNFYILGLSLDLDNRKLYWLAKEHQKTLVYSSRLLSRTQPNLAPVVKVTEMESPPNQSIQAMHYYSNRLFWLSSHGNIVVMDTAAKNNVARLELPSSGQNIASLSLVKPISDMTSGAARGENGSSVASRAAVIPGSVRASSVNISGPWFAFNISWQPTPVPNEQVYYTVQLTFGDNQQVTNETEVPYLLVANLSGLRPYSPVKLTMTSCSYWGCSEIAQRDLMTPQAPPSRPLQPRGFVTYRRCPLNLDFTVDLEMHWWQPEHPNGRLVHYPVMYQMQDGVWYRENIPAERLSFNLPDAWKNHIYKLKVSACNDIGCSNETELVLVNTGHENPVPQLITANDSKISLFLPDAQSSSALHDSRAIAMTFEAQESALYLLDTSSHIVKLLPKAEDKMLNVAGRGKSIAMDWVGRDLYWLEEMPQGGCEIRTYNIDSDQISNKVLQMDMSGVNLEVHPYHSSILWSVMGPDGQGGILKSNMDGSHQRIVVGYFAAYDFYMRVRRDAPEPGCDCSIRQRAVTSVFVLDHSRTNQNEFYVVENGTGSIWASDLDGCKCRLVVNATGKQDELGLPPDAMTVDHMYLYWSNSRQGSLHTVLKRTGEGHTERRLDGVKRILAYGSHLQPFPDPKCLSPNNYEGVPTLKDSASNTSLVLQLAPWRPASECSSMRLPRTRYTVRYRRALDDSDLNPCPTSGDRRRSTAEQCLEETPTYNLTIPLRGLQPDTFYLVEVEADNFHTRFEHRNKSGSKTIFKTAPGAPSEPMNVSAAPRTPQRVEVSWKTPKITNGPEQNIHYEIQFVEENKSQTNRSLVEMNKIKYRQGRYAYEVDGLKPNGSYTFYVVAFSGQDRSMGESRSRPGVTTRTFAPPAKVDFRRVGDTNISVLWTAPPDDIIVSHSLIISLARGNWKRAHPAQDTVPGVEYNDTFTGLEPNTEYMIQVNATYRTRALFIWPLKASDTIKTLKGKPGQPQPPFPEERNGDIILITWTPPRDGGDPINQYKLMAKRSDELNWTVVYNGTETQWVMSGLEPQQPYVFYVRAHNLNGWGQVSGPSKEVPFVPPLPAKEGMTEQLTVILAVFFVVIFIVVALLVALLLGTRFMKRHKPVPVDVVSATTTRGRDGDRELATLRILPSSQTQTNTLYAINIVPTEADVAALPHFGRELLKLTKFLGSGAFGEVFEGTATDILGEDTGDTKVAVKTLRKGASGAEKEEFLKEALLMQNFRHTHILRLLGVCLENDPQFIILELMEGGDLLSYLRNARPTSSRQARLTMKDMVAMCTDVAKGCKYLEDMHFVHRDLAARNCLVSSVDPTRRVVKIGDFGLARDIYKNDYYRKEGEGLLPVRWMSPESLIDGVFTTYSDVWAFGVLMWEVLTLGQQPYPARTNIEVLNYVRGAGRLDRPDNCPDDMYGVMLKCWCFSPGGRPSFNYLLSELESIKRRGVEATNHYTTTEMPGDTVTYSSVRSGLFAPNIHNYTDMSGNKQGSGQQGNDSAYLRPTMTSTPRPRPSATRPTSGSGYLQPIACPDGPNKYLELLADGSTAAAGGTIQPTSVSPAAAVPPATQQKLPLQCGGLVYQARGPGVNGAHSGSEGVGDSDNPSTIDSGPESPDRYLMSRCSRSRRERGTAPRSHNYHHHHHHHPGPKGVDYAQLSLSDVDPMGGDDTDSESTTEQLSPVHYPRGHHHHHYHPPHKTNHHHHHPKYHHPGGGGGGGGGGEGSTGGAPSSSSSRPYSWGSHRSHNGGPGGALGSNNQTQYAQIASTDSDTDNEILIDRCSRPSKLKSPEVPGAAVSVASAGTKGALSRPPICITPDSTSMTSQEDNSGVCAALTPPNSRYNGHTGSNNGRSVGNGQGAPFTIDGYLAPRSLLALGKQGQSSSSINSNLSNISMSQSSNY